MTQFKITSRDIIGATQDAIVPDAYIDPSDPILAQYSKQSFNPIENHIKQIIEHKVNGKES